MLRSLYVTLVYVAFLVMGTTAPFVLSLGYVWVDTFSPQAVVYSILNQLPVSLIMAVAAIGGYVALDRRKGRVTILTVLLLAFAMWVTLSTAFWAAVPDAAWEKWDPAFKVLCFAAFIPFVFRSRVHIEAFLQIYLFSIMVHFLPVGLKTMISGGGYGRELGIIGGNSLLAEGSTLAGVSLMLVPLILYLRTHTSIVPKSPASNLLYLGLAIVAVAAAVGTYERTALVGMAVVGAGLWLRARRKALWGAVGALALTLAAVSVSGAWSQRISTVSDYKSEASALGRILVWQWTLGYVAEHPLGGGFNVYKIDTIEFAGDATHESSIVHGKAFHSIYFEVLGEQGWVGLGLFGALIGLSFWQLQVIMRLVKGFPEMIWAMDLAYALQVSLLTLLACGAFIGIGFQPMLYYLFAISACLREHVRQVAQLGGLARPAARCRVRADPQTAVG